MDGTIGVGRSQDSERRCTWCDRPATTTVRVDGALLLGEPFRGLPMDAAACDRHAGGPDGGERKRRAA